jgi:hypothetical protein
MDARRFLGPEERMAMVDSAVAPKRIPPNMLQPICDEIGDQFNFQQLDAIIYHCFARHKIYDYTSSDLPRHEIAYACVVALEKEGIAITFLANILAITSNTSKLHELIIAALPEVVMSIPIIKTQVPDVIEGLRRARARISNPAVKAALTESRSVLESVQHGITLLDCYKSLHDCLHTIQLRSFAALLASVRMVANDEWQLASLREYHAQVSAAVMVAGTIVQRLPDERVLKAVEDRWIGDLDQAAGIYRKALDARNAAAAKIAVIKLSIVLKNQSPRLNDLIVAAAAELPLDPLRDALSKVAGDDLAGLPEIAKAVTALNGLKSALRSRVAEHDMWQDVDKGIWYLDELFTQSADPAEDFTAYWPEVRGPARTLADLSPNVPWSTELRGYSADVDEELLRYDAAKAAVKGAEQPKSMLGSVFGAFRSAARTRFFVVDLLLKQDCALLLSIGAPVEQILRDLSDA